MLRRDFLKTIVAGAAAALLPTWSPVEVLEGTVAPAAPTFASEYAESFKLMYDQVYRGVSLKPDILFVREDTYHAWQEAFPATRAVEAEAVPWDKATLPDVPRQKEGIGALLGPEKGGRW
jgi:hypothetical protein